jgi:hypothetical protein
MAFVPEYDHDIFISYAHVDDQPFIDATTGLERSNGWISTLVRHLKNELAQKIGRADAVSVWFDSHNLRGHHSLFDEIAARLERSALFIPILSPGYVASQWCQDEAQLFAHRLGGDLGRRVFVIDKTPLDDDSVPPPALAGRRAYRFWYRDRAEQPRTFAVPMPHPDEIEYFRQIEDLARDLRDQCRAMRGGSQPSGLTQGQTASVQVSMPPMVTPVSDMRPLPQGPVAAAPISTTATISTATLAASTALVPGVAVLLAEVTDDLEFKRDEVQRYLEQQGVPVLPELTFPLGRADFEAALDADLASSRLFVQLLGPIAGKRPRDIPDGYGWLQLEGALRRGVPILQWRSPDIDPQTIEWQRHRELLERETVQATSLESFKRAILAALAPPPPAPEPRRDSSERPLVFLNTEMRHRAIAAEIRGAIGNLAVWTEPLFEGPAEMVREDLEQNLIDCDAMVMVYADNPGWARAQLRNFHKLAPRRDHPVRSIPVIDAPPTVKPELGFFLPEMVVIDGRSGIGPDALGQLSASLLL